jgi:hypothetical protein
VSPSRRFPDLGTVQVGLGRIETAAEARHHLVGLRHQGRVGRLVPCPAALGTRMRDVPGRRYHQPSGVLHRERRVEKGRAVAERYLAAGVATGQQPAEYEGVPVRPGILGIC